MTAWVVVLFLAVCVVLLTGYPVAACLAGAALLVAGAGTLAGSFDPALLAALPNRVYGVMTNPILTAVPLFIFMGVMLERSRVAEHLLQALAGLFGHFHAGLGISVVVVGMLLAASTGIVGATVVAMGLLSMPTLLARGYPPTLASGTICAAGTLGQLIPPSIVLVLLGDVISNSYQQSQLQQGVFAPEPVSVSDLFAGALLPGVLLVVLYIVYIAFAARRPAMTVPALPRTGWFAAARAILPTVILMVAVLGSILAGLATPTEAAAVGAAGAALIAWLQGTLDRKRVNEVLDNTLRLTAMVFFILIGANVFSLVFRGFGGDELVHGFLHTVPGGAAGAMLAVMAVMFALGFILDFIEITFVVVPIVAPALLAMGLDPVWLGVMIALNLQTSFLTPPFGFALFYLRGVAPDSVATTDIYRGVAPFVALQLMALAVLALVPALATWLPRLLNQG